MIQFRPKNMVSPGGTLRVPLLSIVVLFVSILVGGMLTPVPAQAQDSADPDLQEKRMRYSLYWEDFKNENYEAARDDLLWIIENAPGFQNGDDRNYERVVELYQGLAAQASDEATEQAYLDTAATYLASAPEQMEEQGIDYEAFEWEVKKGRFMQEHGESISDVEGLEDPIAHYQRAFELAPQELNVYYIRTILQSHLNQNDLKEALAFVNTVEEKRGDDEKVTEMISSVRDRIFDMNPQAQIAHLEEQAEQYPDSTQLLTQLFEAYTQQGNISKASELAPRLMDMEPPAETVRQIAEMRLENGRPEAALQAYNRAEQQGAELQAEDYFNRGTAYQEMDELSNAREEYRNALEADSEFGRAYLGIGDLYAKAVNECSGGQMTRKDRAVYWAAVDKYQQAKSVDPSIASTADNKIRRYREVFPTSDNIFMQSGWEKGESFTIDYGCYSWIGETTTIRPSPDSG